MWPSQNIWGLTLRSKKITSHYFKILWFFITVKKCSNKNVSNLGWLLSNVKRSRIFFSNFWGLFRKPELYTALCSNNVRQRWWCYSDHCPRKVDEYQRGFWKPIRHILISWCASFFCRKKSLKWWPVQSDDFSPPFCELRISLCTSHGKVGYLPQWSRTDKNVLTQIKDYHSMKVFTP